MTTQELGKQASGVLQVDSEETVADGVRSYIPRLIKAKGWSRDEWRGTCLLHAHLSTRTADRLFDGDTNITVRTLRQVAPVLGARSISDLVEFTDL